MSLEAKLAAIRDGSAERIPADSLEKMGRATKELSESGIGDQVIQSGTPMPEFLLNDTAGKSIDSKRLTSNGPLVVTFYRGTW